MKGLFFDDITTKEHAIHDMYLKCSQYMPPYRCNNHSRFELLASVCFAQKIVATIAFQIRSDRHSRHKHTALKKAAGDALKTATEFPITVLCTIDTKNAGMWGIRGNP